MAARKRSIDGSFNESGIRTCSEVGPVLRLKRDGLVRPRNSILPKKLSSPHYFPDARLLLVLEGGIRFCPVPRGLTPAKVHVPSSSGTLALIWIRVSR